MTAGKKLFHLNICFSLLTCPERKATTETLLIFLSDFLKILFKILFVFCSYILIVARTWQPRNWEVQGILPFSQYLLIPL